MQKTIYHYNDPQSTTKARISALLQSDPQEALAGIRQAGLVPKAEVGKIDALVKAAVEAKMQDLRSKIVQLASLSIEAKTEPRTANMIISDFCRRELSFDAAVRAVKAEGRAHFFNQRGIF